MGNSEREGMPFRDQLKIIMTASMLLSLMYLLLKAPKQPTNTQVGVADVVPQPTPAPVEQLFPTPLPQNPESVGQPAVPQSEQLLFPLAQPTPAPVEQLFPTPLPQNPESVGQPITLIVDSQPIAIVDLVTQKQRFEQYRATYENLINSCASAYGLPNSPEMLRYMMALIENTYIGEYGQIKLVYSSQFDQIFSQFGFDTPQKASTSYAQVCVGLKILNQTLITQGSVMGGYAEYNGGAQAGWLWHEYVRYLNENGGNGEARAIASLQAGTIEFDPKYIELRRGYEQYLQSQGYDVAKVITRVEEFLTGVATKLYPR